MGADSGRYRGTEGRISQWLRRRPKPQPEADDAARLELLLAVAEAGMPISPAAHPSGYRCSCERIGCPTPARHPVSFAWQTQSTTDRGQIERWAANQPLANFITATGMIHDVLDVPLAAGQAALDRLTAAASTSGLWPGPVPTGCSSSPPPAAHRTTRTSGGRASWTATPRPWTSIPVSAGTAGAATSSCPREASR